MPISQFGNIWEHETLAGLEALGSDDNVTAKTTAWVVAESGWYYPAVINAGTSTWTPLSASSSGWEEIYDVDFTSLGNIAIPNSPTSIGGVNWTPLNHAKASTIAVQSGTGLRIINIAGAGGVGSWIDASQLGIALTVPVISLDPDMLADDDYRIKFHFDWAPGVAGDVSTVLGARSVNGMGTNNSYMGASSSNIVVTRVNGNSDTQSNTITNASVFASDVAILDITCGGTYCTLYAGTYAGGWPSMSNVFRIGAGAWGNDLQIISSGGISMSDLEVLIGIHVGLASVNDLTIMRMTVDRYRAP